MFQIIGIITLFIGSFLYTEEVSMTSKTNDELLNEIIDKSVKYKVDPAEAIISDDTIIPGIKGREVNIKESYEKMREVGYFNEKLLIYKDMSYFSF